MPLEIAVVIATHNREASLRLALEGIFAQTLPADRYEVVVVDNACSDGTAALVHGLQGTTPNLRYLFEPQPGLSSARNRGWRHTTAPLIAFLDDDAVPRPNWLERTLAAFDQSPRPACVGGRVIPDYETAPPPWLTGSLLDYLSVVDHSSAPRRLTGIRTAQKLAGVNFAASADALIRVGGFSTRLGRVGTQLICGEDVLVQLQFEALGLTVYYDPSIVVSHYVSAERLTPRWLERRAFFGGVSDAWLVNLERDEGFSRQLRTLLWSVRHLIAGSTTLLSLLGSRPEDTGARCRARHRLGFVAGSIQSLTVGRLSDGSTAQGGDRVTVRNG